MRKGENIWKSNLFDQLTCHLGVALANVSGVDSSVSVGLLFLTKLQALRKSNLRGFILL